MGQSQSATMVWRVLHYLEGLRRLGHEVFYVEDTGDRLADPTPACDLVDRTMARLGLGGQWLLRNAADGEVHGFLARDFAAPFVAADVLLNLTGSDVRQDEHAGVPHRIDVHLASTAPPVVLDWWATNGQSPPSDAPFTVDGWSFDDLLDLPSVSPFPLDVVVDAEDRATGERLRSCGWRVRAAATLAADVDGYRDYLRACAGELAMGTWSADRSAHCLAAGRPVVVRNPGFGAVAPTGQGLIGFTTREEAIDALHAIAADPVKQQLAASELAAECFEATKVVADLLATVGVS
jgi:hypothetical protein